MLHKGEFYELPQDKIKRINKDVLIEQGFIEEIRQKLSSGEYSSAREKDEESGEEYLAVYNSKGERILYAKMEFTEKEVEDIQRAHQIHNLDKFNDREKREEKPN